MTREYRFRIGFSPSERIECRAVVLNERVGRHLSLGFIVGRVDSTLVVNPKKTEDGFTSEI